MVLKMRGQNALGTRRERAAGLYQLREGGMIKKIKRLLYWLPVILQDRDWDPHYFYRIMGHKLSSMERFYWEDAHHVGAKKESRKIKVARILCDRLVEDEYLLAALTIPERDWGGRKIAWSELDDGSTMRFDGFEYEKAHTEKEIHQADDDYFRWGRHADNQRIRDIEYLFDWIKRHIERWWD